MKILIACEESQRVCKAFRKRGHEAYSCDILECSGGHLLCEKYNLPLPPTQIIHPWMFGEKVEKTTCLWIKGLKPLTPLTTKKPELEYFEWIDKKTHIKKRQPKWYYEAAFLPRKERSRARSRTFKGIAEAMANQWG